MHDWQNSSPTDDFDDPRLLAAVKAYMAKLDADERPDVEAFVAEHPHIAQPLRLALEGLAMVHGAASTHSGPKFPVVPDAEFTAKPVGDFQIIGELGRGGMGIVYEAIQLSLGRRVALKVLPLASSLDASRLQRFRNEAHAAAQLHHTNIVPVYAVGSDRGVQYYAMQLIEGRTLAELIHEVRGAHLAENEVAVAGASRSASRTDRRAIRTSSPKSRSTVLTTAGERKRHYRTMVQLAHQATLALEHAHQYGVVHRDIKPGNLLLDNFGKLWVADFGLAQIEQSELGLTRSGDALGTARYMSPEQAAGNRTVLDHRTDIYSLGVTLYEMLTLQPAVRGTDYRQLLNQVVEQEPLAPIVVDPSLPLELDTIVRKAISKEPSQRYLTAQAFGDDLMAWLHDKPIAAQPPSLWERLAKWRKRNSRLVAVAASLMVLASVGLLVTTLLVLREQWRTSQALASESRQRAAAERSFQQARRAVETFSELSETELAYRPEFQNLRRRILETSLDFYRDFLLQRSSDVAESQELKEASAKVERLVEDLRLLDEVSPLLLLADARVRQELSIDEELSQELLLEIDQFQAAREQLGEEHGLLLVDDNDGVASRLREFVTQVGEMLNAEQIHRLRQIVRQQQLPFTFLSMEIVEALQLTPEQRQQIAKIIEEERPQPGRASGTRPEREPPGPRGGVDGPAQDRPGPSGWLGMEAGPHRGARGGPDRRGPPRGIEEMFGKLGDGPDRRLITERTVARIQLILTPVQRETWNRLIGSPFDYRRLGDPRF